MGIFITWLDGYLSDDRSDKGPLSMKNNWPSLLKVISEVFLCLNSNVVYVPESPELLFISFE
jgi:hypothetical protein